MRLLLITPPASELMTLAEAKVRLRVDHDLHDTWITSIIKAARLDIESRMGRAILPQTWELRQSSFGKSIDLPWPAIRSITSVTYLSPDGQSQTLASDQYTLSSDYPPALYPVEGESWPAALFSTESVVIRYQSGTWATAADVPSTVIEAMTLSMIGLYQPELASAMHGLIGGLLSEYTVIRL